jgi:ABC-type polysaccharide/polyol phosphate export permease
MNLRKSLRIGLMLGWQDIRQSYRRSVLGQLWITVGMAVTVSAIGIVFGTLFGTPLVVFLPYLASGLIIWGLISGIVNEGSQAFISAEGMIKQIPLPKLVFIVRVVWRNLIITGHNMVIFPVAVLLVGGDTSWSLLIWPVGVLLSITSLAGLALIVAIVAARFRDVPQIVSAILTVAFYITPVIWMRESVGNSELVNLLVSMNPLYHILQVLRTPLIGQYPTTDNWVWVIGSCLAFWAIGLSMFLRYKKRIAYWV